MSVDTEIEIDLSLFENMDEELPCEHIQHEDDKWTHDSGTAVWYAVIDRSCCIGLDTMAVCDRHGVWRQQFGPAKYEFECFKCGGTLTAPDAFVQWKRIKDTG